MRARRMGDAAGAGGVPQTLHTGFTHVFGVAEGFVLGATFGVGAAIVGYVYFAPKPPVLGRFLRLRGGK